jgi:aminoglycoside/choline kinase family phosphotransferase
MGACVEGNPTGAKVGKMKGRCRTKEAFVASAGWETASIQQITGDASNRKYDRLTIGSRVSVLMDADPTLGEDVHPFIFFTNHLIEKGFSAPKILASDTKQGFLLLEDLGDDLFARICRTSPQMELVLYENAVDALVELHTGGPPIGTDLYDGTKLYAEAALVPDWYAQTFTPDQRTHYQNLVLDAVLGLGDLNDVLVLRDYHAENLLWLPNRQGVQKVGMIDYQDALAGHRSYDLMSLLEDARRDTTPELRKHLIRRYLSQSGLNEAAFLRAYSALAAIRNLKIVGIFARLCMRDGKPNYLSMIPRVWDHLMRDLRHPALAELADFVRTNVPKPSPEILAKIAGKCRQD